MTFEDWIISIFDHPVTTPEWYWEAEDPFWEGPPDTLVSYLARLFARADTVLSAFSEAQAAQGLWAVIGNGPAEYAFTLLNTSVPLRTRLNCIAAMQSLFRRYFAVRCTPHLSHRDRVTTPPHVSPLNVVCYMWWDLLPLHGLAQIRPWHPDAPAIDQAILSVIESCLRMNSVACQESALHGLMEWSPYYERTSELAAEFVSKHPHMPPELRAYALQLL